MNERLRKIKQRLAGTPYQKDFDLFLSSVREKVEGEARESVAAGMVADIAIVVADVKELLSRRDQGFRDLHAYLEFQRAELAKSLDVNEQVLSYVLDGVKKLSESLKLTQKVSITNPAAVKLTKSDIRDAFIGSLEEIQKVLSGGNELPDSVKVGYDSRLRLVNRIEETYPDHRIIVTIQYDSFGNVSGWQTVRE